MAGRWWQYVPHQCCLHHGSLSLFQSNGSHYDTEEVWHNGHHNSFVHALIDIPKLKSRQLKGPRDGTVVDSGGLAHLSDWSKVLPVAQLSNHKSAW